MLSIAPAAGVRFVLAFLVVVTIVALCSLLGQRAAEASCNLIPPAERTFPSTLGSVTSPLAAPGHSVVIKLGACDASAGFDATAANNAVVVTFQPPGGGAQTMVPVASGISVDGCGATCTRLEFTMPETSAILPPDGAAGPARVAVTVGAQLVADIGPLFAPRGGSPSCDQLPEKVFQHFTVLPPPNDFEDLVTGAATRVLATLDGNDNVLVPFDYTDVLPLGPGSPIARLLSATSTIDAFSASPGAPVVVPDSSYVRSFTLDGRPLAPLVRATAPGDVVFGAADGALAIVRIARTDGAGGAPIYDFTDRLSNAGRGPIIVQTGQFAVAKGPAVPLQDLHASKSGVAFARDEEVEGDLNLDGDTNDRVVQTVDAAILSSVNTLRAAARNHNPLVGDAAVETDGQIVAMLESEAGQGNSDLNGDGDKLDDIVRVLDLAGVPITPSAALVGRAFPAINRKSVAIDGQLVYFRAPAPGISLLNPNGTLIGDNGVALSPDGRLAFTTISDLSYVTLLRRNAEDGSAAFGGFATEAYGPDNFTALGGASGILVSADSRFAYIAGAGDDGVQAAEILIDPSGGGLGTFDQASFRLMGIDAEFDGQSGVTGLAGVSRLALSPNGAHLYAAGTDSNAVAVFSRDALTGTLTYVEAKVHGSGGVTGMLEPRDVAVSPDGATVYVAAHGSDAVTAFTRNTITGALTFLATYADTPASALIGARRVVVAPDGLGVYVAAEGDGAISVFSRNTTPGPALGTLTFASSNIDGVGGVTGIASIHALAISPDGAVVYAGSGATPTLAVFSRTLPGGALTFVESEPDPLPNLGAGSTEDIAVSPDGEYVYHEIDRASGLGNGMGWERNATLRVFDSATQTVKPGLTADVAGLAAVAGGRAVFVRPEGNAGGTDLNGDGDTRHRLAFAYDSSTDTTSMIGAPDGVVPELLAMSKSLIAMSLPEAYQPLPADLDGSGQIDEEHRVLAVLPTSDLTGPLHVVPVLVDNHGPGIAVTDLCADGTAANEPCGSDLDCPGGSCAGVVVFGTAEFAYASNADLNGDGDISDVVLTIYRSATDQVVNTGQAVKDFIVSGNLVALRTPEVDQGAQDLNGNGSPYEDVMQVWDLRTDSVINSGQAVIRCEQAGCTPGLPYRVLGDSILFLTREQDQGGQDLDGNGLFTDTVQQVFVVEQQPTCGNGARDNDEECDAFDAPSCTGVCGPTCTCCAPIPDPKASIKVVARKGAGVLSIKALLPLGSYAGEPVVVQLFDSDSAKIAGQTVALAPKGTSGLQWLFKTKTVGLQKVMLKDLDAKQPGNFKLTAKAKRWFAAATANQAANATAVSVSVGGQCFGGLATKKTD